jgi:hypothetical protein
VKLFIRNVITANPIMLPAGPATLLILLARHLNARCNYQVAWPGHAYIASSLKLGRPAFDSLIYDISQINCFHIIGISTFDLARVLRSQFGYDLYFPAGYGYDLGPLGPYDTARCSGVLADTAPSTIIDVYCPRWEHWLWREPLEADGRPYGPDESHP